MIVQVDPTLAEAKSLWEIGFPAAVAAGMTGITTLITYIIAMRGLKSAFESQKTDRENAFVLQRDQQRQDFELQRLQFAKDFEQQKLQHDNNFEIQKLQHRNEFETLTERHKNDLERELTTARSQREEKRLLQLACEYAELYHSCNEYISGYLVVPERDKWSIAIVKIVGRLRILELDAVRRETMLVMSRSVQEELNRATNQPNNAFQLASNRLEEGIIEITKSLQSDIKLLDHPR